MMSATTILAFTGHLLAPHMSAFGCKADMPLECAPRAGQVEVIALAGCAGLSKDESHGQTTTFAQH